MRRPGTKRTTAPVRRRNATATRAAILTSARQAFARAGYDGVGVREIAKGAGVTAMLVNRYFGSKEQLFGEVVADIMARPIILTERTLNSPQGGEEMAAALVDLTSAEGQALDGFRIMLHSASSPRAAEIGRGQIEAHYHKMLTAALRGDHAPQRAALLLAFVAGFQVMRQMVGLSALAECPPKVLVEVLAPLFQQLWTGESRLSRPHQRRRAPL
ncbi:MAG: TetR family transcriptional regulator [Acidobacteria bacterium 13_1_40CM_65_14]|nr:MAG: TetR family transcriptional regulator [Acidobacteria bacterium 13_1_40CM_65_14]